MSLAQAAVRGPNEAEILARCGGSQASLLGAGGESRVLAIDEHRVVRIFHPSHEEIDTPLVELLASWEGLDLGFGVPAVLDVGRIGQQSWTIDRRIPGRSLDAFLRINPNQRTRRRALAGALEVAGRLRELPLPAVPPGQSPWRRLIAPEQGFASLPALLLHQMDAGSRANWDALAVRVPHLAQRRAELVEALTQRQVQPAFVHGDLGPGNVLCDEQGNITGICDVSPHALAADPVLDQVGIACLLLGYPDAEADARWLGQLVQQHLGSEAWLVSAYRQFYGLYYAMDSSILDWCAAQFTS